MSNKGNDGPPLIVQSVLAIAALAAIALVIDYSFSEPPSGKAPGLLPFTGFWLREIVLLGFALAALVIAVVGWGVKRVRRRHRVTHRQG